MSFTPKAFLKNTPKHAGVYQMFDSNGKIIYVGKARNLKSRLSSYFRKNVDSIKTQRLVEQIADIQITLTTETEALLFESNLIKQYRPRYNVLFRDDKSYPYLHLSTQHPFPRLDFYRGQPRKAGKFYGPYPDTYAVRQTLNILQKLFRIRSCNDNFFQTRSRPCLQYQINRCTAPCVDYISREEYARDVAHIELFLAGKNNQILKDLMQRMEQYSENLEFELAATLRDQIQQLRKIQEQQTVTKQHGDVDAIALLIQHGVVCVNVVTVRRGMVLGNRAYFPSIHETNEAGEIFSAFLAQYYLTPARQNDIPTHIVLNTAIEESQWLEKALTEFAQHQVKLSHHVRTQRAQWLALAMTNAEQALKQKTLAKEQRQQQLLSLQKLLKLPELAWHMECFDVSHTGGEAAVTSCVVFEAGQPKKSAYRRYNIKDITPGDDYAALAQALERRYKKLREKGQRVPDVIIIDGGKGQLNKVAAVLEESQMTHIPLLGIAKGAARKPGLEDLFLYPSTLRKSVV